MNVRRTKIAAVLLALGAAVVLASGIYVLFSVEDAVQQIRQSPLVQGEDVTGIVLAILYGFVLWEFASTGILAYASYCAWNGRLPLARTLSALGMLSLGELFLGSILSLVAYLLLRGKGNQEGCACEEEPQ